MDLMRGGIFRKALCALSALSSFNRAICVHFRSAMDFTVRHRCGLGSHRDISVFCANVGVRSQDFMDNNTSNSRSISAHCAII